MTTQQKLIKQKFLLAVTASISTILMASTFKSAKQNLRQQQEDPSQRTYTDICKRFNKTNLGVFYGTLFQKKVINDFNELQLKIDVKVH